MGKYPVKENYKNLEINDYNRNNKSNKMYICLAYEEDLEQLYAFYCARYENITFDEFMNLGWNDFRKKIQSIPKKEPLYEIIKSRAININKIKDKEEKKYWQELKKINEIPPIFKSNKEIKLENNLFNNKLGGVINGKRFN